MADGFGFIESGPAAEDQWWEHENLAGYTPAQRKKWYETATAEDWTAFTQDPNFQTSWWAPMVAEFNTLMGTDYTSTTGAQALSGVTDEEIAQWIQSADPSAAGSLISSWGLDPAELGDVWGEYYGVDVPAGYAQDYFFPQAVGDPNFNIPMDVFPFSQSSSQSGSSSYSGLPPQYQEQVLGTTIPQLLAAIQNMPGNIDQYLQDAMNAYTSTFKNMASESMPGILNEIFGRNMQESSISGDITSNVMSNIVSNLQPQAYQTAMQAASMKAGMPGLLSNIAAALGKTTKQQSHTSSSSLQANPLAPYQLAAQMLMGT